MPTTLKKAVEALAHAAPAAVKAEMLPGDAERMVGAVMRAIRTPSRRLMREIAGAMSPGKRPTQARVSEKAKHGIRWRAGIDSILKGEG